MYDFLTNIHILLKVIEFNKKFYPYNWVNYDEIFKGSIRLIPDDPNLENIKNDYELMKAMIFGEIPKFEEILIRLESFEKKLNNELIKYSKKV